jgi:hypothetical protein
LGEYCFLGLLVEKKKNRKFFLCQYRLARQSLIFKVRVSHRVV